MIKLIAVDMDGTFLNAAGKYNQMRFNNIYKKILAEDIRFVVASGNQYAQLKSFFLDKPEITFVAENGALIVEAGKIIRAKKINTLLVPTVLSELVAEGIDEFVLCGVKQAYILARTSQDFKDFSRKYYFELAEIEDFQTLPQDDFVKFALDVSKDKVAATVALLNEKFGEKLTVVASGHGSIDMMVKGVNKGQGIQELCEKWEIPTNQILAFGDAHNDLEMLALTENSYAMKNASPEVITAAKNMAPSNQEEGVLEIIEKYF